MHISLHILLVFFYVHNFMSLYGKYLDVEQSYFTGKSAKKDVNLVSLL